MTCEHAETTVLLYLFGEAPAEYEEHLAQCEECQEALAEHAATVRAVEPVFRGDGEAANESAIRSDPRKSTRETPSLGEPSNRRSRALPWLVAAAAAAVAFLLIARWPADPRPTAVAQSPAGPESLTATIPAAWTDPIEEELDDIAVEFDLLARDMEDL